MCGCTGNPCFQASHPQRQARRWCGGSQWGGKSTGQSPRFGLCFNCWQDGHFLTAYYNTRNPDLMCQWLLASSSRSRDPAHRQPENRQWLRRCRANQKSPLCQGPKKIKFKKQRVGVISQYRRRQESVPQAMSFGSRPYGQTNKSRWIQGIKELISSVNGLIPMECIQSCIIGLYHVRCECVKER